LHGPLTGLDQAAWGGFEPGERELAISQCFNADCLYSREVSAQARDEKSWTKNQHTKTNTKPTQKKPKQNESY
jgi:hypothetical protein